MDRTWLHGVMLQLQGVVSYTRHRILLYLNVLFSVICLRTTERVRRDQKNNPQASIGNSKFVLPAIKKLGSSVPVAEVRKKNKENCKHVLKRIVLPLALLFRRFLQISLAVISILSALLFRLRKQSRPGRITTNQQP
jgi:hypothetical protein